MPEQLQVLEKSQEKISAAVLQADSIIMKKYMPEICHYSVKNISSELESTNINSVLRINRIEKIVFDADENNLDKLMNVYHSVALCKGALIHIIISDGDSVEYYIGTRTNNVNEISTCQSALVGTFEGNFPGSKLCQQDKTKLSTCMNKIFSSDGKEQSKVVSVVSGIPGLRSEDSKEFIQGMEKLIDSMSGKRFAMITIADPVLDGQLLAVKDSYEELYTQLSPFSQVTQTYSESDSSSLAENISDAITESVGNTVSNTTNQSRTVSTGSNISKGSNLIRSIFGSKNKGSNYGKSDQTGSSYSDSESKTYGSTQTRGKTDTFTTTTGQTLQLVQDNKRVSNLLLKIEKQIERIEDAKDTGLWNAATYCLAEDAQTSKILAGALQSLCRGKKNTIENYSINTWTDRYKLKDIESYLKKMVHPVFEMSSAKGVVDITPASMISGAELVITAGLPQKAVSGVSISKMVSFARNVTIEDEQYLETESIELGHIYHMGKTEKANVCLDLQSLSSHMLVTGSTGSGKSNTVYGILHELKNRGIKFLVIEPAKGEYKNVFGNDSDVSVYGTNRKCTELLKIDPFAFPDEIHVLEHIDRLVEIFNVCWPMYAAMPAILKDAILQSYIVCGWDLELSENVRERACYPTFKDVQVQIRKVLDSSDYSDENKGNYVGALVTRINSLTNGINGQMFTANEIPGSILFDTNVIVDLSRVGAQETKSLIMGILVMKLNEYRMANACSMNSKIKHVTVLEEAHNLLRNNEGKAAGAEGADLSGKSVEMITNSIAEMRTYGEGFIIVDQSPGAIDISAIRNTNTKILMRLPEENDRQQAGRSAGLNEKQIPEMAKLPKGVAVVYQNNWLDPVLCKINKAGINEAPYRYTPKAVMDLQKNARKMIAMLLVGNRMDEILNISTDAIRTNIDELNISTESKLKILDAIVSLEEGKQPGILEDDSFVNLSKIVCEVINYPSFRNIINTYEDVVGMQEFLHTYLESAIGDVSTELELALSQCVVRMLVAEDMSKLELYSKWREYAVGQRKKVL